MYDKSIVSRHRQTKTLLFLREEFNKPPDWSITNVNYACEIDLDSFQWTSHRLDSPDVWAYRVLKKSPALEWSLKGRTKQPKPSDENCHLICHGIKWVGFAWLWPQVEHNRDGFIYKSLENFSPHHGNLVELSLTDGFQFVKMWRLCNSGLKETGPPVSLERDICCLAFSSYPWACTIANSNVWTAPCR